jgi:hypothetical protein
MIDSTSSSDRVSGGSRPERARVSTFGDVLDAERAEIRRRRAVWTAPEDAAQEASDPAGREPPVPNLVGLALSGGGIRSATFALGLLQGMSRLGILSLFDYLSSVSGGGYTAGWWSGWLSRRGTPSGSIFPPPEKLEPERPWPGNGSARISDAHAPPDASLSAGQNDPIHHLRLFSNYLTPRKGLLSADTWRATTVVGRNLVLTWLVLLPVLLAAVVAGQLYFTFAVHPGNNFLRDFPVAEISAPPVQARVSPAAAAIADGEALAAQRAAARADAEAAARDARTTAIRERVHVAAWPLIVLMIWSALLTFVWMVHGSGSGPYLFLATLGGASAALFIGWTLYGAIDETPGGWPIPPGWTYILFTGGAILLVGCRALPTYLFLPRPQNTESGARPEELLRNRVVRALGSLVVTMVLLTGVLLVAGFSHDLVWFLFDPASGGPFPSWVKATGGWAAVLSTLGAMAFTGFMGAPSGGAVSGNDRPSRASQLLFAVTPVLALSLLAVFAATVGRILIQRLGQIDTDLHRTDTALLVATALFVGFAVFETLDTDARSGFRRVAPPIVALAAGALFFLLAPDPERLTLMRVTLWAALAAILLLIRWSGVVRAGAGEPEARLAGGGAEPKEVAEERRHRRTVGLMLLAAGVGGVLLILRDATVGATRHFEHRGMNWDELAVAGDPGSFSLLLLAIAMACGVFAATEQWSAPSSRFRSVALLTVALLAVSTHAVSPFLPLEADSVAYSSAAMTVMVLAIAWVVGLGWMANPNMLSLHAFYTARLVRAYLGASNTRRRTQEITEAAIGDDLPLSSLANCDKGAPYQLINTTLNLVGGGDLTTVQRSADSFLLSKHYCGSARTGYRPTREYMDGKLTLGSAVAISGAAASPNMGSQTPSAALSMLLALLNVRLAFWAPTPNRSLWRDSRPRLWPFYWLREFLSQTTALSPYCCLSDGGHFDNTGLYELVARGCRYIVLSDCGADPVPCFQDLGNAIRRCRIDFGAEIDLRIDHFLRSEVPAARAHFMVGTITYAEVHARSLGWRNAADPKERQGVVIWLKPSLTMTGESADLRQYAIENPVFPQQSTSDQWYDEAQFESYRRLGEYTAQHVFGGLEIPDRPDPARTRRFFEDLRSLDPKAATHFKVDIVSADGKSSLQIAESPAPAR